jgi:hypothetical protein
VELLNNSHLGWGEWDPPPQCGKFVLKVDESVATGIIGITGRAQQLMRMFSLIMRIYSIILHPDSRHKKSEC